MIQTYGFLHLYFYSVDEDFHLNKLCNVSIWIQEQRANMNLKIQQ